MLGALEQFWLLEFDPWNRYSSKGGSRVSEKLFDHSESQQKKGF